MKYIAKVIIFYQKKEHDGTYSFGNYHSTLFVNTPVYQVNITEENLIVFLKNICDNLKCPMNDILIVNIMLLDGGNKTDNDDFDTNEYLDFYKQDTLDGTLYY